MYSNIKNRKMKEIQTEERPTIIICAVLCVYALLTSFAAYFYLLHRISLSAFIFLFIVITLVYLPRFAIIYKLKKPDEVKIIENYIMINGCGIDINDIVHFGINKAKPKVIFFMNNRMVVFNEAKFCIRTGCEEIEFCVFGEEKINLLKNYLTQIIQNIKV